MRSRMLRAGVPVALLLLAVPYAGRILADPPSDYVVESLGTFGGDTFGRAINSAGVVAGYGMQPDGARRAFVADDSSVPQVLPTLGGTSGQAFGINDEDVAVGVSATASGSARAFRAEAGGLPQDLGTLGGSTSQANAVNASGAVVGYSTDVNGRNHAFRYTDALGFEDLGTLGGTSSFAWGINAAGDVAGQSFLASGFAHAFLYRDGSMQDLGTLGGNFSTATAVNDAGVVVGSAAVPSGTWHAFRRVPGQGLQDLGTLGGAWSSAEGVNGAGVIVGWAHTAANETRAVRWTAENGLIDLNTLIDPASGWVLISAQGVNASGQMTGYGRYQGATRAFRLTPLQPVDTMPPVISSVTASPSVLTQANHRLIDVTVTVTASDDSGATPGCAIADAVSNEPDNGLGDGDTSGDVVIDGAFALRLRAERSAHGSGRVYEISVTCSDEAGNAASAATFVVVPREGAATAVAVRGGPKPK